MIQRDYILRMTELVAKALAKILQLKEQMQYSKALDGIDLAGKELLGSEFQILRCLSDKDLIKWMFSDGYIDSVKCISLCHLLKAEGEILELQGEYRQSRIRYLQALSLLNEAVQQDEKNKNEENAKTITWLMNKTLNEETI